MQSKPSLAGQIWERIKAFLQAFGKKSDGEPADIQRLRRTEELFRRALESAGEGYIAGELARVAEENAAGEVDGQREVQYNSNEVQRSAKRAQYIPYARIGQGNVAAIRRQLSALYQGAGNSIANGIAIAVGNTVYIVDSGKENGEITFGVRKKITISNAELRAGYIRSTNDESVSKGYVSDELSSGLGTGHDNDRRRDMRRESGAELSADTGASSNNQGGVPDANANRGGAVKKSRKPVVGGGTYTEEQYRRFGWVRANEVLTSGEWEDFTTKFAGVVSGQTHTPKTKSGEYMIAVSDVQDPDLQGINNIIVYAKGTIESPQVTRVLRIDLDNETELDIERRNIYAAERRGIQQEAGELRHLYVATNFQNRHHGQGNGTQESRDHDQLGVERSGGRRAADRIKEFHVNDDGSFTTIYADGRKEIRYSRKPADGQSETLQGTDGEVLTREMGSGVAESRDKYSYDALIGKPDMIVKEVTLASSQEAAQYRDDTVRFGTDMRKIAAQKNHPKNTETSTYLHCADLNCDVLITKDSFKHGGARLDATYLTICKNIDVVLANSVVVNELNARENTDGGYILLGLVETQNDFVVVRSVINKKTHRLIEFQQLDAIKKQVITKIEDDGLRPPDYPQKRGSATSSTISIAGLLNFVKSQKLANEIFSVDVAQRMNVQRAEGSLTPGLRYSRKPTEGQTARDRTDRNHMTDGESVDSGKPVRYSRSRHFTKQDISAITRASYMHHAWATNELTGCLTPSEISEFNRIIGQIKAGIYQPIPLSNGKYLIEVGEYVNGNRVTYILTDGVWEGQSIEWVGKIVTNDVVATKDIKEYVNELSETIGCEAVAMAFEAYATIGVDEGFREFTLESSVSYEEFSRQRAASRGNTGHSQIRYSRSGNVGEAGQNGIKPVGKPTDNTVTLSKGQLAKLKANYHGEKVFEKVKIAEALMEIEAVAQLKPATVNRLIDKLWKGFNGRLGADAYRIYAEAVWDHADNNHLRRMRERSCRRCLRSILALQTERWAISQAKTARR